MWVWGPEFSPQKPCEKDGSSGVCLSSRFLKGRDRQNPGAHWARPCLQKPSEPYLEICMALKVDLCPTHPCTHVLTYEHTNSHPPSHRKQHTEPNVNDPVHETALDFSQMHGERSRGLGKAARCVQVTPAPLVSLHIRRIERVRRPSCKLQMFGLWMRKRNEGRMTWLFLKYGEDFYHR